MTKAVIKEFWKWLVANLFLPLVAPFVISIVCLFLGGIFGKMAISSQMISLKYYSELGNVLLINGVYSFVGITFLLSLFYDYRIAKKVIDLPWFAVYLLILFALGGLFIHSLGLVVGETTYTPEARKRMFFIFSGFAIVYSIPFKIKIIKKKISNEIYSSL
jgi:hypothetical protein